MQVQLQAARHPYAGSLSLRGSTSVCMSLLCTDPLRIKVKVKKLPPSFPGFSVPFRGSGLGSVGVFRSGCIGNKL